LAVCLYSLPVWKAYATGRSDKTNADCGTVIAEQ
jgi:hypothetical protein